MTQVTVGENEGIESALRRFKRQVSKAGIFGELKRLRHHETPVEKYKRKLQQRRRSRRRWKASLPNRIIQAKSKLVDQIEKKYRNVIKGLNS